MEMDFKKKIITLSWFKFTLIILNVIILCLYFVDLNKSLVLRQQTDVDSDFNKLFSLKGIDLDSNSVDFKSDYINYNYIIINIWATWCQPCVDEIPILNKFKETNKKLSVKYVSISYNCKKANTLTFLNKHRFSYTHFMGDDLLNFNAFMSSLSNKEGLIDMQTLPITLFYDLKTRRLKIIKKSYRSQLEIQNDFYLFTKESNGK
jgi:thiol-disulfide isomerase/thioredoxin